MFNVKGEYFALLNKCPHNGGSLVEGVLTGLVESSEPGRYAYSRQGEVIRCPWHGWEFDIITGKGLYDRNSRVATYKVEVEDAGNIVLLL